jgi:transposase
MDLSETDLEKLEEIHRCLRSKHDADKVKAIILLAKGWSYPQIEEALLLDERTIHRYRQSFQKDGIDGLLDNKYKGGFCKLTVEEKELLTAELKANIYSKAKAICNFIYKTFGKTYTAQGLVPLLHSIGFSYKKTKAIPGKLDASKQEAFIREYEEARKAGKKVYFGDSVHPTHNMLPDYAWLPTGEEKHIKSNPGRERINIVGVYSPNDQSIITSSYSTVNADAISNMLKKIRKANPVEEQVVLILDNARYNYNKQVKALAEELKIELKYLPPYSPNLNLIERLWKYMKKEVLANKYYETFDTFKDKCLRFLKGRSKLFKKELSTLMSESFHLFPVYSD